MYGIFVVKKATGTRRLDRMATPPQTWASVVGQTLGEDRTSEMETEAAGQSQVPWPPSAADAERMSMELETVRVNTTVNGDISQVRLCPTQEKRVREGSTGATPEGKQPVSRTAQLEDPANEGASNLDEVSAIRTRSYSFLVLVVNLLTNRSPRRTLLRRNLYLQMYLADEPRAYAYDRAHSVQLRRNNQNRTPRPYEKQNMREMAKIFTSCPNNDISFTIDEVAVAILRELAIHEVQVKNDELFIIPSSSTGPYTISLPQEAAYIILDEGKISITSQEVKDEPVKVNFKVLETQESRPIQGPKYRTANAYREAEIEFAVIYDLDKDHAPGLMEKGAHDEPIEQIKNALFEVIADTVGVGLGKIK